MDGPVPALTYLAVVVGVLALVAGGVIAERRRARARDAPQGPVASSPVADAPEAPPLELPAEAPPALGEEAPGDGAPVASVAARGRVRSIGASLVRLFGGNALTTTELADLEEVLLRADVGVAATARLVDAVRARPDALDALRAELLAVLGDEDRTLRRKPDGLTVWLVTGVNGVGKTTTIGKLAARMRDEGRSVLLAAADTFRAAADQQLELWASIAGAEVIKHPPGADPAAVAFDGIAAARARGSDVLIVDTAGRLQTRRNLMEELSKVRRVLEREAGPPDEVLLVLDATTGQNGVQQARAFTEAAGVTGLVLAKLDGTAKGGIVVAVQQELGIPVKLVGLGEGVGDLAPFDPEAFVEDLLSA